MNDLDGYDALSAEDRLALMTLNTEYAWRADHPHEHGDKVPELSPTTPSGCCRRGIRAAQSAGAMPSSSTGRDGWTQSVFRTSHGA